MDEAALIGERAVGADEDVVCDRLAENLDLENVCDNLLRLAIYVRMDEGDVVVRGDDVAQRGETLFDALDGDCVWDGVPQMLKLLVRCRRRYEQAMSIAWTEV